MPASTEDRRGTAFGAGVESRSQVDKWPTEDQLTRPGPKMHQVLKFKNGAPLHLVVRGSMKAGK